MELEEHPAYIRLHDGLMKWISRQHPEYTEQKKEAIVSLMISRKYGRFVSDLSSSISYNERNEKQREINRTSDFYSGAETMSLDDAEPGQKFKYISLKNPKKMLLVCIERRLYKYPKNDKFKRKGYYKNNLFEITTEEKDYRMLMRGGEAVLISDEEYNALRDEFLATRV